MYRITLDVQRACFQNAFYLKAALPATMFLNGFPFNDKFVDFECEKYFAASLPLYFVSFLVTY
jgi:zona occludens toxin (predicted ATPase)